MFMFCVCERKKISADISECPILSDQENNKTELFNETEKFSLVSSLLSSNSCKIFKHPKKLIFKLKQSDNLLGEDI